MAVESRQLSSLLANQLERLNFNRLLQPLVKRVPVLAKILAAIAALPGLIILYGFPITAIILLMQLPQRIDTATSIQDWVYFAISLLAIMLCGWMTWLIIRTPLNPPHGLALDHASAPALLDLIDELENHYGRACIHSVVLRSDFDIQLVRTPRFGLPILTNNILTIGLPLLLSLPPSHFKALLARRIGQASGKHNRISGWFYQLKGFWCKYRDSYARQKSPAIRLLGIFFKFYTPFFYEKLAFFAIREDELEADQIGIILAAFSGYDPSGLKNFILRVNHFETPSKDYKGDHPIHTVRANAIDEALKANGINPINYYKGEKRYSETLAD